MLPGGKYTAHFTNVWRNLRQTGKLIQTGWKSTLTCVYVSKGKKVIKILKKL